MAEKCPRWILWQTFALFWIWTLTKFCALNKFIFLNKYTACKSSKLHPLRAKINLARHFERNEVKSRNLAENVKKISPRATLGRNDKVMN